MTRFALICLVISGCLSITAVQADDLPWKVGLGRRNITPEQPVFLAGYASRDKPFEGVVHEIHVKALALEDAAGHLGLLVTSDLIGFRNSVGERVCEQLQQQRGLERRQILLNSSHTHTGPTIFLEQADAGDNMTAAQAADTIAYSERLIELTVDAALDALDDRQPATLSHGIGVCRFAMNRREWTPQGIKLGFNPGGYVDRSVPVLRIDGADGRPRAVLFGAGAHNTTLTGQHFVVSGDYAGYAQTNIEAELPGVQAMFMLGCAGSANPYPRGTLEDVQSHGAELGEEVVRVIETELSPLRGPLTTLFDEVALPLHQPVSREEIDQIASGRGGWQPSVGRKMIQLLESGQELPAVFRCPVALWQFGDDLTLVGLSGEVVNEYVPLIEEALGPGRLWISAYCNNVFGYVPTAQILRDGGYETRGVYYGAVGFFSPQTETVLVNKVRDLAVQAGRKLPGE